VSNDGGSAERRKVGHRDGVEHGGDGLQEVYYGSFVVLVDSWELVSRAKVNFMQRRQLLRDPVC